MPTPRHGTACVTTEQALVVAGGYTAYDDVDTVEVMSINTKQWSTVCPLPQKIARFSGIACGDTLYLAGGYSDRNISKSVFTCSLPDLQPEIIQQTQSGSDGRSKHNVWKEIRILPVSRCTPALFGGHFLAIGGSNDSGNSTTDVYRYDSVTDLWNVISQMKNKRSHCLAVTLPHDQLVVVGGSRTFGEETDSVELWGM